MGAKKAFTVLLFCCLPLLPVGAQGLFTVPSYTWYNQAEVTAGFKATAAGTSSATLTLRQLATTAGTRFLLTYPDGSSDELQKGMYFYTEAAGTAGYTVHFRQAASEYLLTVVSNTGDLDANACFYLTVSGIGNSTANSIEAVASVDCGVLPYGAHWQGKAELIEVLADESDLNLLFTVKGLAYTAVAHKVTVWIRSSVALGLFDLRGFTFGPTAGSSVNVSRLNTNAAVDRSLDVDENGTDLTWRAFGGNLYSLVLEANEDCTALDSPTVCDFSHDETWQLTLKNAVSALETGLDVSLQVQDKAGNTVASSSPGTPMDPVSLRRPPPAAITGPVNQPAALTLPVMRGRQYTLRTRPPAGSEELHWFATAAIPASQSTFPSPTAFTASTDSINTLAKKRYFLKHQLAVAAPDSRFVGFTHFSFDTLTVESQGKEQLGFPNASGVPYDEGREPYIDGIVEGPDGQAETSGSDAGQIYGENGWRGAYRITHADGTIPEDVAFQALRSQDGTRLYLSFEVDNDTNLSDTDVIVLGIRPNAAGTDPADDRLLRVYPKTNTIRYYRGSAGWQEYAPTLTSGFAMAARDRTAAESRWSVELRLPVQAQGSEWPQIQGDFLLYYDVFRTYSEVSSELVVSQFGWPRFAPKVRGNIDTFQFSPAWWGEARRVDPLTTNGVDIAGADIGVIPNAGDLVSAPSSVMPTDPSRVNTFVARVHTPTTREIDDGAGGVTTSPREVSGVNVTFRIANWGVPSTHAEYWEVIPANVAPYDRDPVLTQTSPTFGDNIIEGDGVGQYEAQWQLTAQQRDRYVTDWGPTVNELHQCIHVLLDASGNVDFVRKSVVRNMNFDAASKFTQEARIDGRGYGAPPLGWPKHRFLLFVNRQEAEQHPRKNSPASSLLAGAGAQPPAGLVSQLVWSAHAQRYTGEILIIDGTAHQVLDPVGSFGHVMSHPGEVRGWTDSLEGTTEVSDRLRVVEVPPEQVASAKTVIEAVEPLGLSLSLHAGAATPLPPSAFANDYRTGFCLIGDAGYRICERLAVIVLLGYSSFPAAAAGDPSASVLNLALNAKYFLPVRWNMRLGVGLGPELFLRDWADVDLGYDLDLSLDLRLNRLLTLEAGAIYHSHFDQQVWFLQTHAGLVLRL